MILLVRTVQSHVYGCTVLTCGASWRWNEQWIRRVAGVILKLQGELFPPTRVGSLFYAALICCLLKPNLHEGLNLSLAQPWDKTQPNVPVMNLHNHIVIYSTSCQRPIRQQTKSYQGKWVHVRSPVVSDCQSCNFNSVSIFYIRRSRLRLWYFSTKYVLPLPFYL